VGTASLKVLTAEIMGRHSNLVFWNHADKTIIAASHLVTKDMSRQREILLGAKYVRPPVQEKPNVFQVPEQEFLNALADWLTEHQLSLPAGQTALESFLLSVYSGLGRNLAHEIVAAASERREENESDDGKAIWQIINGITQTPVFRPAVKKDLSRYTILSLDEAGRNADEWRVLPAVNDLVDDYYRTAAMIDTFRQTRERMLSEAKAEVVRLESRLKSALEQIVSPLEIEQAKLFGDLILANLNEIKPGQDSLVCENVFVDPPVPITIALNNNLTASQNAQNFYRQFAKSRSRERAASLAQTEAEDRLRQANHQLTLVEQAKTIEELQGLRKEVTEIKQMHRAKPQSNRNAPAVPQNRQKAKTKLLTINSSDGWSICVGRNRHENDFLLSRIAQPQDLWLHILGQSGAHVLIRVPNNKQEPPLTTIREAAQIAARFSKTPPNTKVRVVYTQCRYVKKVASGKPGVVRYENEKTIEVDTTTGMPEAVKKVLAGPRAG
jgi:predicted ribosome quality control (RQC) complex YloA/Tae2 family protein